MDWFFGDFALSKEKAELRGPDGPVAIEKQPLELLMLLAENAHRVVSKEEVCEVVWQGRFISDATISTALKFARKAVGDDGTAQAIIKTVHGRGFRFVAPLRAPVAAASQEPEPSPEAAPVGTSKPSIAVLRFFAIGDGGTAKALSDAIPAELISTLSRLRWAQVIARGSSFRFAPDAIDPADIGRQLGARYLVSGSAEVIGDTLSVSVELLLAQSAELVWSDVFSSALRDINATRKDIVTSVLAAMELELPSFEAEAARRLQSDQFDAWSHYHLGLRHVYRFTREDNAHAAEHFANAIMLDPGLARAHAGRSLVHWQDAFMQFGDDRAASLRHAIAAAERGLTLDDRDPFSNFNMGRAKWLEGDTEAGLLWLDRALLVNPNYAQCYYSQGLASMLLGRAETARASVGQAMVLSPLDPFRYGMLATDAMAYIADGDFDQAARFGDQAARSPGAHFYILWISALAHELRGDRLSADARLKQVDAGGQRLTQSLFFAAFPFSDPLMRETLSGCMARLGVD